MSHVCMARHTNTTKTFNSVFSFLKCLLDKNQATGVSQFSKMFAVFTSRNSKQEKYCWSHHCSCKPDNKPANKSGNPRQCNCNLNIFIQMWCRLIYYMYILNHGVIPVTSFTTHSWDYCPLPMCNSLFKWAVLDCKSINCHACLLVFDLWECSWH